MASKDKGSEVRGQGSGKERVEVGISLSPDPRNPTPAIILVHPQMGENIGAAARAMMNFGLSDLRLVKPRDGWPNDKAYSMASGASGILDRLHLFDTTEDAIADLQLVYATTARTRDMLKPCHNVVAAADAMHAQRAAGARCGILFGAERTGLTNEEIALADAVVTIPTDPENASLNIAQSIVIVAYEWFKPLAGQYEDAPKRSTSQKASPVTNFERFVPATKADIQGFYDHLEAELDRADFFKNPDKKPKMWRNLRNLFSRTGLSEQDVRTLRGVIRSLVEGR